MKYKCSHCKTIAQNLSNTTSYIVKCSLAVNIMLSTFYSFVTVVAFQWNLRFMHLLSFSYVGKRRKFHILTKLVQRPNRFHKFYLKIPIKRLFHWGVYHVTLIIYSVATFTFISVILWWIKLFMYNKSENTQILINMNNAFLRLL